MSHEGEGCWVAACRRYIRPKGNGRVFRWWVASDCLLSVVKKGPPGEDVCRKSQKPSLLQQYASLITAVPVRLPERFRNWTH